MGNLAKQTFTSDSTFVVPAGVKRIRTISTPDLDGLSVQINDNGLTFSMLFIDNNQNMWGVGANSNGQLGNATVNPESSPTLVVEGKQWLRILLPKSSAGGSIGGVPTWAFDTQGLLWGWGYNNNGELTGNSQTPQSSPFLIATGMRFKQVVPLTVNNVGAGLLYNAVLAIDINGKGWAWGNQNQTDILGIGSDYTSTLAASVATAIAGNHIFKQLFVQADSAPGVQAFALDTAGALWAWGMNSSSSSGTGNASATVTYLSSPTLVLGATSYAQMFSQIYLQGAQAKNFFLDTSNNIWGVGGNQAGSLGASLNPGMTTQVSVPVQVSGSTKFSSMYQQLFGGTNFLWNTVVAIDTAGNAWAWGNNGNGALGIGVSPGVTAAISSPVQVVGGLKFSNIYSLIAGDASGNQSFFGLTTDGKMYSWGANSDGVLGLGDLLPRSSPVLISFPAGFGKIKKFLDSQRTLMAMDDAGHIYTWGYNDFGQTGVGTAATNTPQLSSPVVVAGSHYFTFLYADKYSGSVYAVDNSGKLWAWGFNINGQLADGTVTSRSTPVQVVGGQNFNVALQQTINEFDVTPGASLPVMVSGPNMFVGETQVGFLKNKLVIEYNQQ